MNNHAQSRDGNDTMPAGLRGYPFCYNKVNKKVNSAKEEDVEGSTSFGYWLRRRRKALDLTQDDLARCAGCVVGTIKSIEADARRPSRQLAERLAMCLALAAEERELFLKSARAELSADRLASPSRIVTHSGGGESAMGSPATVRQILPNLPAGVPLLRSLDARPTNLPAQPTALIGREREIADVCAFLRRPEVRLLTLTGPGGIGKTRLAVQAAAELLDAFADGVIFVDLAPISDPNLVISTIAQIAGLKRRGEQRPLEQLKKHLREKQLLLLIDNFEQVADAASDLADLLTVCPQLKVVVTSREILHLRGEKVFPVPSLALPDRGRLPLPEQLVQYAAVALFIQRAQDVTPAFVVTAANAPAVAEICQRLDGLPLAIELAAARIRLFTPQALLKRLHHRLPLLTGGARDLPARQQTLRATIDWSYNLLDPGEQALFRRLGVFVGGCTIEAAEAVCNSNDDLTLDVVDGIAALLDQSLLRQAEAPDDVPRFALLETIREYALEQLEASEEAETIRQRHAEHYLALAEQAELEQLGPARRLWLDQLEAEHDNLRTALAWCRLAEGGAALGLRLAGALLWFWVENEHIGEAHTWLEGALERSAGVAPPLPASIRAKAIEAVGGLAELQEDYARATTLFEQGQALYQEAGNVAARASLLLDLARVVRFQGDYERAQTLQGESLALCQEQENTCGTIWVLMGLGDVAWDQGDITRADLLFQEVLASSRAAGLQETSGWALWNLGKIACARADYTQAASLLEESLALFQSVSSRGGAAWVLFELGRVARAQGDAALAQRIFEERLIDAGKGNPHVAFPDLFEGLAGVVAQRQPARAARLFGAAEALRETAGTPLPPVNRADYARDVAAARAHIGEDAFAAAWAAGRALSLERAIADVLDEAAHNRPDPLTPRSI
jgi:predicted ATPase/DNA-binding XRE family transcriptional regulator